MALLFACFLPLLRVVVAGNIEGKTVKTRKTDEADKARESESNFFLTNNISSFLLFL